MSAIIVDTNVLVRAFLSGARQEDKILKKIFRSGYNLVYSRDQLNEFVEVLGYKRVTRKYILESEEIKKFLKIIKIKGRKLEPEKVQLCRDPDDNHIIGLAMRAAKRNKAYLVTGDKDILDLKEKIEKVKILTPGEFLKI